MADRDYIIELVLRAKNETARAFAEATGELKAYEAELDRQRGKAEKATFAQRAWSKEIDKEVPILERRNKALRDTNLRNSEAVKATTELAAAQRKVNRAESEGDVVGRTAALVAAADAHKKLIAALQQEEGIGRKMGISRATATADAIQQEVELQARIEETARIRANDAKQEEKANKEELARLRRLEQAEDRRARREAQARRERASGEREENARRSRNEREARANAKEQERLLKAAQRPAETLADPKSSQHDDIRAQQSLTAIHRELARVLNDEASARIHIEDIRANALRNRGMHTQAAREEIRLERDMERAYRDVAAAKRQVDRADNAKNRSSRPYASAITRNVADTDIDLSGGGGRGGILGTLTSAGDAGETIIDGIGKKTSMMFELIMAAMGPLSALIVGLVAAFASVYSAVIAAATAIGATFISSIAQALPVIGLFSAALLRLQSIMSYVQALNQQRQQRFIAGFEAAKQNAMGINQIAIAEHNYSDALYAAGQAAFAATRAQFTLTQVRQQATRQLQDLIFQEEAARLAAQASSLAVTDAQKALQEAIRSGGDVAAAQLNLQQAHLSHVQAVNQAQRSAIDAAPGSIARSAIQNQIVDAQRNVVAAQRAVVDSRFQIAQARAAIIQARQAAAGYNIATAAQLAWLRAQMTLTERALAGNIQRIFMLFQGVHGRLRPVTDAILAAFIPLTTRIYQAFTNPRIFGALLALARQIGGAIRTITNTIFSNRSIDNFIKIVQDATANMHPFAVLVSAIFRSVQAIAVAAAPFVHQLLGYIVGVANQFATWAESTRGKNFLKDFFDTAFRALRSFLNLGLSLGRFILAVIGVGGGAKAGIGLIDNFRRNIDKLTASINKHGHEFQTLHKLWSMAGPALHALGVILGALGHAFLQIGGSRQGQSALQSIAQIIARVIIPAFTTFILLIGRVSSALLKFFDAHPQLEKFAKDFIVVSLAVMAVHKVFSNVFWIIGRVLVGVGKLVGKLGDAMEFLGRFSPRLAALAGPIGLVVGAIVAIAAATHTLGNLWDAIKAPFVEFWNQVKKPLDGLVSSFKYFIDSFSHARGPFKFVLDFMHNSLVHFFDFFKIIFGTIGRVIGRTLGGAIKIIADVFKIIGDIIRGNWGKLGKDALKLGKDILNGIWNGIKSIGDIFINIFKAAWQALLSFLGIASPSTKGKHLGKSLVQGILDGLSALGNDIINFGKNVIKWIVHGIKSAPGALLHAIEGLLPAPLRGIVKGGAKILGNVLKAGGDFISSLNPFGAHGGPVAGTGNTDSVHAMLMPGEHVWTKSEVATAGGHGAMFAMRAAFGGGGQASGNRYAEGGIIARSGGQLVQGVFGAPGADLANIILFAKNFQSDWRDMWTNITEQTLFNTKKLQDEFDNWFSQINDLWSKFNESVTNQLDTFNKTTQDGLTKFWNNFKETFTVFAKDTFNAFWYIGHEANKSLQAFGAKPTQVHLDAQPKFNTGGFVGNMGERGRDAVHALLGRGEAVLNYAHQKVVDPALRAVYGFGLPDLFKKVRGSHAGGDGYATGGYVYPFPAGTVVGRTDMGVDANMPVGAPIGPMGPAQIMGVLQNWFKGQPLIWWKLLGGPRAGQYAYVAEEIMNLAPVGARLRPNQAVARYAPSGTGIEYGWATASGQTLAQATSGYSEGQVTPAGTDIRNFIAGLAHGQIVGGPLGSSAFGTAIQHLKEQGVRGSGALASLLRHAIHRVTGAANNFLDKQGGAGGAPIGNMVGNIIQLARRAAQLAGVPWNGQIVRALLSKESSGGQNLPPHNYGGILDPAGPFQIISSTFKSYEAPGHTNRMNPWDNALAAFRYIKSRYQTLENLARITGVLGGGYKGYSEGGFVGGARPIIAHVGEWVLNDKHKAMLANVMGTSVGKIRDYLGLKGGKTHFADGGIVGLPTVNTRTGAFDTSAEIPYDTPQFSQREIGIYNRAARIISRRVETNAKNFKKGVEQFLSNYQLVGGDNGIFAAAATAISDYITQQSTVVQFAAAGVKVVNEALRFGRPQGPLGQARSDLAATIRERDDLRRLQISEVAALRGIQDQLRRLGRPTRANMDIYTRLVGARQDLLRQIHSTDQSLAQSIADRYDKAAALFQAQTDRAMRLPGIRAGLFTAAQSIAQTLGNVQDIASADRGILGAAREQQRILQRAYTEASRRARRDPRWQRVADDLLGQLESATEGVVQAQATALSDAMSRQDTQSQRRLGFLDVLGRFATVHQAIGTGLAGSAQQIAISQGRAGEISSQIGQYQSLLAVATREGNVTAMNTLTDRINDLNATLAETNLQTQQLVTAYRQQSLNILNTQSQATGGFFQAATSIAQTLGQIAGNQNLPSLIAYARDTAANLIQQSHQVLETIYRTMVDPNSPFGASQGQANSFLQQLASAFMQGPQAFANTLANLGPALSQFEAGLPQDQQTLFSGLISAMIDNTTSTVNNTESLKQLNAQTNQQDFASSAWQLFRIAIFNGLGQLLPNYAMSVPGMDVGGMIMNNGLLYGHKGETIVPAIVSKPYNGGNTTHQENHFHIDHPVEVADPVLLGNAVAWRLSHDPNSR